MGFTHDICVLKLAMGLGTSLRSGHTDILVGMNHKMTGQQTLSCFLSCAVYIQHMPE